ncbi:hypothetical protein WN48_10361 [Eufriesea mexicana]|nr:hypothetical protein WN48_10361 [Eufriesea mexicana]
MISLVQGAGVYRMQDFVYISKISSVCSYSHPLVIRDEKVFSRFGCEIKVANA